MEPRVFNEYLEAMNRKRLFVGKLLINGGICWLMPLYTPWLSDYTEGYGAVMLTIPFVLIIIGIVICKTSKGSSREQTMREENVKIPLVMTYFKIIKWVLIVAVVFNIIAACVIAFFYCLNKEFEATLMITTFVGIVIGFIWEVAIPYYENYKDQHKTN